MATVKNINGTSGLKCKCGSWLDHWKKFSGQKVNYCVEVNCREKEVLGAHVQKSGIYYDDAWYIVPLCAKHNQATASLQISDAVKLVPANKALTCG
jgi:hypothetical protein